MSTISILHRNTTCAVLVYCHLFCTHFSENISPFRNYPHLGTPTWAAVPYFSMETGFKEILLLESEGIKITNMAFQKVSISWTHWLPHLHSNITITFCTRKGTVSAKIMKILLLISAQRQRGNRKAHYCAKAVGPIRIWSRVITLFPKKGYHQQKNFFHKDYDPNVTTTDTKSGLLAKLTIKCLIWANNVIKATVLVFVGGQVYEKHFSTLSSCTL